MANPTTKAKKSSNPTAVSANTLPPESEVTDAPVFQLNVDSLDYSDDAQLQDELAKSGGKYFEDEGNVDLVCFAADFHKNKKTGSIWCPGDSTWFNVKVSYRGPGDKEIDNWLQVPTTKIKFGAKDTLAVYKKLQQFFFSLGEDVNLKNLGALCAKYFADPSKLIGTKANVDLGFEGAYVAKLPDSDQYGIYSSRDKPVLEDGEPIAYPDRGSAVNAAKARSLEPSFVRIVKFTPKPFKKSGAVATKSPVAAAPKAAAPAAKAEPVKAKKAKAAPAVVVEEEEEEETEEAGEAEADTEDGW